MLNTISIICGIVVLVCGIVMFVGNNEASATKTLVKKNGEQPTPEQVEELVRKLKKSGLTYIGLGAVLTVIGIMMAL